MLKVGDTVTVAPHGARSTVTRIDRAGVSIDKAVPGQAISVVLADQVDVSRGDVLLVDTEPTITSTVIADVCWMHETPLEVGGRLWFKHGTRVGKATVTAIEHRVELQTLDLEPATALGLNDLGRVTLSLSTPIAALPYAHHAEAGRLILIDERDNVTAGAAMIAG